MYPTKTVESRDKYYLWRMSEWHDIKGGLMYALKSIGGLSHGRGSENVETYIEVVKGSVCWLLLKFTNAYIFAKADHSNPNEDNLICLTTCIQIMLSFNSENAHGVVLSILEQMAEREVNEYTSVSMGVTTLSLRPPVVLEEQ